MECDGADKYVMVIDTETTGLPPRTLSLRKEDINFREFDACRMVQIAWGCYGHDGRRISEESFILKPDGFDIPWSASAIHGITTERAASEGVTLAEVLPKLFDALQSADMIVAHNVAFDYSVISAEIYRFCVHHGGVHPACIDMWTSMPRRCTMHAGTLPGQRWPKLKDLYARLYGVEPGATLHRADEDVRVCADVFFRLEGVY